PFDEALIVEDAISLRRLELRRPDVQPVRLEFDRGIEADLAGIEAIMPKALDGAEERLFDADLTRFLPPDRSRARGIRKQGDSIDQQQGTAMDLDVSAVAERSSEPAQMISIVLFGVLLMNQDISM